MIVTILLALSGLMAAPAGANDCAPLLDHRVSPLSGGESVRLCDRFKGQVLLVVNTASKCAFTPQYEGLEALHAKYGARGFRVLGFPSNDFGNQEPGTAGEIQKFCRLTYGVRFPMFEKTRVRQPPVHPLYEGLAGASGERPRWNFHKYLLDRDGRLVASLPSQVSPESDRLVQLIESLL